MCLNKHFANLPKISDQWLLKIATVVGFGLVFFFGYSFLEGNIISPLLQIVFWICLSSWGLLFYLGVHLRFTGNTIQSVVDPILAQLHEGFKESQITPVGNMLDGYEKVDIRNRKRELREACSFRNVISNWNEILL